MKMSRMQRAWLLFAITATAIIAGIIGASNGLDIDGSDIALGVILAISAVGFLDGGNET